MSETPFNKESPVPERSWRLRPYLGYDWIAGMAPRPHLTWEMGMEAPACLCTC